MPLPITAVVVRSAAQVSKPWMKVPLSSEKAWTPAFHPGSGPTAGRAGGLWPGMLWGSSGTPQMVPALARRRFHHRRFTPLRREPLIFKSPK